MAPAPGLAASNGTTALTADELHEILECEKIVRFRDSVLAGTHPRIKPPPHLAGKQISTARNVSSPNVLAPRPNPPSAQGDTTSTIPGAYVEENQGYNNRPNVNGATGNSAVAVPVVKGAKSEINPILLEKSDDLIKAEIQLQRQRLERGLREQVEQRRLSQKAALQSSESLPDFDLSDVLSRALSIVHPSTVAEAEQSVDIRTSASDSFDENTFYSSQHDTPDQSTVSHENTDPVEIQLQGIESSNSHSLEVSGGIDHDERRDVVMSGLSFSHDVVPGLKELQAKEPPTSLSQAQPVFKPTDSNVDISRPIQLINNNTNTNKNSSTSLNINSHAATDRVSTPQSTMDQASKEPRQQIEALAVQSSVRDTLKRKLSVQEETLVRTFELSPVAPQPARVSPLATARAPPVVEQPLIPSLGSTRSVDEVTSAQVTGLRTIVSSPESSLKGSKSSEKDKRKKRKKTGRKSSLGGKPAGIGTPGSPYIKHEPRSPSPFGVAPLPRPHKRQRQALQQGQELNYDEPRYETPRDEPQEAVEPQYRSRGLRPASQYRDSRDLQRTYDEDRFYEPRDVENVRRVGGDDQYRRVVSHESYRAPRSPGVYAIPYSPRDRPVRAASHVVIDRPTEEQPRYYREAQPLPSGVFRVDVDDERPRSPRRSPLVMAPPQRQPVSRIVLDEYGRQYYTPAPAPIASRQPVASGIRPIDDDYVFERPPPRSVARPASDLYEADGVVYRRASPQPAPRRVVTIPDHDMEYRSYRQREYSTRPVAVAPQAEEYVRVIEPERRQVSQFEEVPREYHARVGSVRPETVRYELPREYVARGQTVRPEGIRHEIPLEYVARGQSVRPELVGRERPIVRQEPRRDAPVQTIREISNRPGEQELVRREYLAAPDRFAVARPVARRTGEEVEYIERPREASHMYVDDARREVIYR